MAKLLLVVVRLRAPRRHCDGTARSCVSSRR